MAFSGTSTFEKFLSIDDIITESFERLGFFDYSGNDLRSARRSLNIMFQEWDNRGLHFWEVARTAITLASGQNEYTIFRSPSDGNANGITTTLTSGISSTATTIPVSSTKNMNDTGKIRINSEVITYTSNTCLSFPDSQKIFMGAGNDLQLYHDGTSNFIHASDGDLNIVYSF